MENAGGIMHRDRSQVRRHDRELHDGDNSQPPDRSNLQATHAKDNGSDYEGEDDGRDWMSKKCAPDCGSDEHSVQPATASPTGEDEPKGQKENALTNVRNEGPRRITTSYPGPAHGAIEKNKHGQCCCS